jgi:predicted DNA-binding transcriptional regulator YafY
VARPLVSSRAQRLLDLLQILRRHRHPVTGAVLSRELGISLRSLYRDIAALQAQGARIDGAPGLGYILRPGFTLPPLMFTEEELEALMLGSRWVADRGDARLGEAARNALAKIAAVLPGRLRDELDDSALLVGPGATPEGEDAMGESPLPSLRQAIRGEKKIAVTYLDLKGKESSRTLWPFALAFFDRVRVVVAWCETRKGFRHFRTDRIGSLAVLEERYPRKRQALLQEWRESENIRPQ